MKRNRAIILFLSMTSLMVLMSLPAASQNLRQAITSPQFKMVGARLQSLGGNSPTILNDVSATQVNPAALGEIEFLQSSLMTQSLLGEFDYLVVNTALPMGPFVYGFSYGQSFLSGIPETVNLNNTISSVDTFSAGYRLITLSMARADYFSNFYFDKFSYGFSLKALQQVIKNSNRMSYGLDMGLTASFFYPESDVIDRVHVGGSVLNLLGTELPAWTVETRTGDISSEASQIRRQYFLGAGIDMFDDTLNLTLSLDGANGLDEYAIGAEYDLLTDMSIRGSAVADLNKPTTFHYNIGTGLLFRGVIGLGYDTYNLRLDYNYAMHLAPFNDEPTHTIGFSILGESKDPTPKLIRPFMDYSTRFKFAELKGTGLKKSRLILYNNDVQVKSLNVDKFGRWEFPTFPLKEGENEIYARSVSDNNSFSESSRKLLIHSDTISPRVDLTVAQSYRKGYMVLKADISEKVDKLEGQLDGKVFQFKKIDKKSFEYWLELPEKYKDGAYITPTKNPITVTTTDDVGNTTTKVDEGIFISMTTPTDLSIHYGRNLSIIGSVSDPIKSLSIDGEDVYIDKNNVFKHVLALRNGKNLMKIHAKTDAGHTYTYYARLLRLYRFSDIPKSFKGRRDIELLASMGYIEPRKDGNFYPEENLTRIELAKFLVKMKKLPIAKVEESLFLDVGKDDPDAPFIQTAIEEGLMQAFPDGTFKKNEVVSVADAHNTLYNNDIIDDESLVIDPDPITRADFALKLKGLSNYQKRVDYLLNWDKGYKKN